MAFNIDFAVNDPWKPLQNSLARLSQTYDEIEEKKRRKQQDELTGMKMEETRMSLEDLRNTAKQKEEYRGSLSGLATQAEREAKVAEMAGAGNEYAGEQLPKVRSITDELLKRKAEAGVSGDREAYFKSNIMLEQMGKASEILAKSIKIDPTGNLAKQQIAANPELFQNVDPETIKFTQEGAVFEVKDPQSGQILGHSINTPDGKWHFKEVDKPNAPTEAPASVREWENYIKLSPEEREMYLTMKRAQQNIDLGGSVVQPSMGVPGKVVGEFDKTLPPDKTPQAIGEAETAKRQAELAAEKKKMYPKARETKISLERQWEVVSGQIDKAIEKVSPFTAGVGSVASVIPATPQRDLRETLAAIRANIGFDKLQDMRNNSPTGGALGQVSDTENKLLQAVHGSLDQGQSPAQLKENLVNIKMLMNELKEQKKTAFATDFGEVESGGVGTQPQQSGGETSLPPAAVSQLQPGKVTTFRNGQKWTMGADGQPQQVQ